jgi:phosphoribosylaminoimidazolecarboxamide formyltransferase/IMP cyclohydrolase
MKRAALISVSDKTGLVELARALLKANFVLLATSGSRKSLSEAGIETLSIEEYTGQKEILGGRVKTLHPKIHAGLLARRDNPEHLAQLEADGILPIDVAIINLYPFQKYLASERANDLQAMIELIDVGGPTMLRAAAKNAAAVLPLIDPNDYPAVLAALEQNGLAIEKNADLRARMAAKVFCFTANYDLSIARYLSKTQASKESSSEASFFSPVEGIVLEKVQDLRYGENPQQKAALYRDLSEPATKPRWELLSGKELSYNNLLDFDAAHSCLVRLGQLRPTVVIIKHLNPCGAAYADSVLEALRRAKRCDPRSHFGGVLAFNMQVEADVAAEVREDFAEIVLAPSFSAEALEVLKQSKNLRIIRVPNVPGPARELRAIESGYLIQTPDSSCSAVSDARIVSLRKPSSQELVDLEFAWRLCAQVKSNAIVVVKNGMSLGVGAGQMSRIDSVELALSKAKLHQHSLEGAVAASDAFFPFTDNVETLAKAGITAIISPAGARRDSEVAELADRLKVSLLFTNDRHFRH